MSHLGNKLKAGFFAFPPRQGDYIKQLFEQEAGTAAWLDPTCGEGMILKQLSEALQTEESQVTTYGVEIDKGRHEVAETTLDHAVNSAIETMVIQNDAFSFVFLNPPYDYTMKGVDDSRAERKEFIELKRNTRYVKPGGVLLYVIPSYRFADKNISRFLATHFSQTEIMRFSDEDFSDYNQCVFIGVKKSERVKRTDPELMDFYLNMDNEDFVQEHVKPVTDFIGEKFWTIPKGHPEIKTFYSRFEDKDTYYEGILKSSGFEAFKNRAKPKSLELGGEPILPINQGQMALLLASGAINGLIGEGDNLHLVQGLEIVSTDVEEDEYFHDSGGSTTKRVETTKRSVSVKVLNAAGTIKKLV